VWQGELFEPGNSFSVCDVRSESEG